MVNEARSRSAHKRALIWTLFHDMTMGVLVNPHLTSTGVA